MNRGGEKRFCKWRICLATATTYPWSCLPDVQEHVPEEVQQETWPTMYNNLLHRLMPMIQILCWSMWGDHMIPRTYVIVSPRGPLLSLHSIIIILADVQTAKVSFKVQNVVPFLATKRDDHKVNIACTPSHIPSHSTWRYITSCRTSSEHVPHTHTYSDTHFLNHPHLHYSISITLKDYLTLNVLMKVACQHSLQVKLNKVNNATTITINVMQTTFISVIH